jgi:anti-sigma factor RsiW
MNRHVKESELALFVSGDLGVFQRAAVRMHLSGCNDCRARVEAYRFDRQRLKDGASQLPAGVDWDRLAAEMTANIRVGLAAGECVAPRVRKQNPWVWSWGWRPAAAMAGVAMLLSAAWWLNFPSADTVSLGHALNALVHGGAQAAVESREPVWEVTSRGSELRENGSTLVMSQGSTQPVSVNVSTRGTASAVVDDAGQITITGVYVQ